MDGLGQRAKMAAEDITPCRHLGAPPEAIVDSVSRVIEALARDPAYLAAKGLSCEEYTHALPAAIEKMRGSQSASNADRRLFLVSFFSKMQDLGLITGFEMPRYGDDTVYRLAVPGVGSVAIIQKGCPDGKHSSVNWSRPDWAAEAYLWWLCSSMAYQPGLHVWKGVNRLRQRFFSSAPDAVDGVIFHNELCGTPSRPCPKSGNAIEIEGRSVPPPCLYVMPERADDAVEWNWGGRRDVLFPRVLHAMFDIPNNQSSAYTGHVGFQRRGAEIRTTVSCHFGPGRSMNHRS